MEPEEIEHLFTILFVACTSHVNLEEIWAQETRVQGGRKGRGECGGKRKREGAQIQDENYGSEHKDLTTTWQRRLIHLKLLYIQRRLCPEKLPPENG